MSAPSQRQQVVERLRELSNALRYMAQHEEDACVVDDAISLLTEDDEDSALAAIVRESYALSLSDYPPEAEFKWLFELPMRDQQGKQFKQLVAATAPKE